MPRYTPIIIADDNTEVLSVEGDLYGERVYVRLADGRKDFFRREGRELYGHEPRGGQLVPVVATRGFLRRVHERRRIERAKHLLAERRKRRHYALAERYCHPGAWLIARGVVTPYALRRFEREWNAPLAIRRGLLARAKDRLVDWLLRLAENKGYTYGVRADDARDWADPYRDVLYVDTPVGQVSFHVPSRRAAKLPAYPGEWDGTHETWSRLTQLVTQGGKE